MFTSNFFASSKNPSSQSPSIIKVYVRTSGCNPLEKTSSKSFLAISNFPSLHRP
ncbi:hypothetical protein LguiA_012642 [Lonicera macranthoides]